VLARKWNILEANKEMDDLTLQRYLDYYKKPLTPSSIAAAKKLTEVATMKKKQKNKTKAKKGSHSKKQNMTKASSKTSKMKGLLQQPRNPVSPMLGGSCYL
jgi:hypothetical protein